MRSLFTNIVFVSLLHNIGDRPVDSFVDFFCLDEAAHFHVVGSIRVTSDRSVEFCQVKIG